jgi:hypothetical protein
MGRCFVRVAVPAQRHRYPAQPLEAIPIRRPFFNWNQKARPSGQATRVILAADSVHSIWVFCEKV